jgi:hypothetical protein
MADFDVRFQSDSTFNVLALDEIGQISVDFGQAQPVSEYIGGQIYEGEYVVTPKVGEQTMPTKDMVMVKDVTIQAIPYAEVTNATNGKTVTIG